MKLNPKTLIVVGAIVGAMALEAVVFLILSPSHARPVAGDTPKEDAAVKEEVASVDTAEEPLGEPFNCTNNVEESMMHLRFKVAAVVKSNESVQFRETVNLHKNRVRQSIEKIVRSASREDLNDPNLSTLKRLMKEEVNKVLRKSFVIEAVVYDFSMIEQ